MSSKRVLAEKVEGSWSKLNKQWQCKDADAFRRLYIVGLSEAAETFEEACDNMKNLSADLEKELKLIEQSLTN